MNVHCFLFRPLLGRRLPRTSGKMEVPGISNSVTIRRDTYSILYDEAESDEDAWYGVGFCRGTAEQLDVIAPHMRKVLDSFAHGPRRRELGGEQLQIARRPVGQSSFTTLRRHASTLEARRGSADCVVSGARGERSPGDAGAHAFRRLTRRCPSFVPTRYRKSGAL